jgi:hypothetical protein
MTTSVVIEASTGVPWSTARRRHIAVTPLPEANLSPHWLLSERTPTTSGLSSGPQRGSIRHISTPRARRRLLQRDDWRFNRSSADASMAKVVLKPRVPNGVTITAWVRFILSIQPRSK